MQAHLQHSEKVLCESSNQAFDTQFIGLQLMCRQQEAAVAVLCRQAFDDRVSGVRVFGRRVKAEASLASPLLHDNCLLIAARVSGQLNISAIPRMACMVFQKLMWGLVHIAGKSRSSHEARRRRTVCGFAKSKEVQGVLGQQVRDSEVPGACHLFALALY